MLPAGQVQEELLQAGSQLAPGPHLALRHPVLRLAWWALGTRQGLPRERMPWEEFWLMLDTFAVAQASSQVRTLQCSCMHACMYCSKCELVCVDVSIVSVCFVH